MVTITHDEFGTVEAEDMKSAQKKLRALEREHRKQEAVKAESRERARQRAKATGFEFYNWLHDDDGFKTFPYGWYVYDCGNRFSAARFTDPNDTGTYRDIRVTTPDGTATLRVHSETGEFRCVTNGNGWCTAIVRKDTVYTEDGEPNGVRDMFYAVGVDGDSVAYEYMPGITVNMFHKREEATV